MNINEIKIKFYKSPEGYLNEFIAVLGDFYGEGIGKRKALNSLRNKITNTLIESERESEELSKLLFVLNSRNWEEEIILFPDAVVEGEEISHEYRVPLTRDLNVMDNLDEVSDFYLNHK